MGRRKEKRNTLSLIIIALVFFVLFCSTTDPFQPSTNAIHSYAAASAAAATAAAAAAPGTTAGSTANNTATTGSYSAGAGNC